jgi:four helix bundle protein
MGHVTSFRELDVYLASRKLSQLIFECSRSFPRHETYSLTDQIRRSSRSIGAQIAEAWGKRRYQRNFISKLSDADAEQLETQHWIETAQDCLYLTKEESAELLSKCSSIGKMLQMMIVKAGTFCAPLK